MLQHMRRNYVAGIPPPSTPSATGHRPAATTAAEPPDDPPENLLLSYGFLEALQIYIKRKR